MWANISRSSFEGRSQNALRRGGEMDVGVAAAAPSAITGFENAWRFLAETPLLVGGKLHHAPTRVWRPERCKDLPGDPKVRMPYMRRLNSVRNLERNLSKIVNGHNAVLFLPNVKDEPRRHLARRVPQSELDSEPSLRSTFGRTRRDRCRRWLWRLVGRLD
jgi:hypothetical protein